MRSTSTGTGAATSGIPCRIALASIANYLAKKGWQRGRDWGFEVDDPGGRSPAHRRARISPSRFRQWASASASAAFPARPFPASMKCCRGMMLVPAGPRWAGIHRHAEFLRDQGIQQFRSLRALHRQPCRPDRFWRRCLPAAAWGDVGKMLRSDVLGNAEGAGSAKATTSARPTACRATRPAARSATVAGKERHASRPVFRDASLKGRAAVSDRRGCGSASRPFRWPLRSKAEGFP